MDGVKVLFSIKGKVVASATTDSSGDLSVLILGRYISERGDTRVKVSLANNKTEYMDGQVEVVNPN
jgi:hypothetical protein